MQRPTTLTCALALALSPVALLPAQSRPPTPLEVTGCYRLTRGTWSRPLEGDPRYHALPDTVRLDTVPAEHGGWRLHPNIAYPSGRRFPGTPRWLVKGDSVELAWSNGYQPTVVSLERRGDGTLRGRVLALSDADVAGEAPRPSALVTARRVSCPATGAPRDAEASRRPAAATDSAATFRGRYLVLWKRDSNGASRIFREIFNAHAVKR